MTTERVQILEMLAEGKVTVDEATRLLELAGGVSAGESGASESGQPKYIRVVVEPRPETGGDPHGERVNVRVPLGVLRAGMKLTALMPDSAAKQVNEALGKQGIDFDVRRLDEKSMAELVTLYLVAVKPPRT